MAKKPARPSATERKLRERLKKKEEEVKFLKKAVRLDAQSLKGLRTLIAKAYAITSRNCYSRDPGPHADLYGLLGHAHHLAYEGVVLNDVAKVWIQESKRKPKWDELESTESTTGDPDPKK